LLFYHLWASSLVVGSDWRDPETERHASPSLETSTLGGEVLRGFGVGCGMVDSRRVVVSSDAVVASMATLERGGTSVEHPGEECAEREVEVISGAYAQGFLWIVLGSRRWR
jgi:hypothetical protein